MRRVLPVSITTLARGLLVQLETYQSLLLLQAGLASTRTLAEHQVDVIVFDTVCQVLTVQMTR